MDGRSTGMIAWKLLQPGAVGLYSGFAWPTPMGDAPGAWVEVEPPLRPSIRGVHAVRTAALLDWLDDELWEIELDGEIVDSDALLVASRGRLLRRIGDWDAAAAAAFSASCVLAVRDVVAIELERSGAIDAANLLAGLAAPEGVQAFLAQLTPADEARVAGLVYLADCVRLAAGGRPEGFDDHPGRDLPTTPGAIAANVAFVSAAGVGSIVGRADEPETFEQRFGRERSRQLAWLTHQLALDTTVA